MTDWRPVGQIISLKAGDGFELSGYRADPAGVPKGGVVVIQEIFGVNAHIRDVVDRFAAEGFAAIAPAIFDRAKPGVELDYDDDSRQQGFELVSQLDFGALLSDVEAAVRVLASSGKVAVVGFCFGGRVAAAAAIELSDKIDAAVGYYGGQIAQTLLDQQPRVPLLLQFGTEDDHIPLADVDEIRKEWPAAEIQLYEGAGHGFNCDHRASYDAKASAAAMARTLAFLGEHLTPRGIHVAAK